MENFGIFVKCSVKSVENIGKIIKIDIWWIVILIIMKNCDRVDY